jgi:phospholipase C
MLVGLMVLFFTSGPVCADGDLHKLNHIIIMMQENHSFDNYFGALAYDPKGPYHNGNGPCRHGDHSCVDGLTCTVGLDGLICSNSNLDDDGTLVHAFHDPRLCVVPDLDHEWDGSHYEANFADPNDSLKECLNDGFVLQNDLSINGQIDNEGDETNTPPDDDTMGFYTQDDIPFYYYLAEHFAIDDRYFASVMGATITNRFYLMAATSFGHLDAEETIAEFLPPPGPGFPPIPVPYLPINGTIFDLLDKFNVSWLDY